MSVGEVASGVSLRQQPGPGVASGVAVVLHEVGGERGAGPPHHAGVGAEGERSALATQLEVEDEVLAVAEPLGIPADALHAAFRNATERLEGRKVAGSISRTWGVMTAPSVRSNHVWPPGQK